MHVLIIETLLLSASSCFLFFSDSFSAKMFAIPNDLYNASAGKVNGAAIAQTFTIFTGLGDSIAVFILMGMGIVKFSISPCVSPLFGCENTCICKLFPVDPLMNSVLHK